MDLICYLHPGWRPLIRPASARRDWMDRTSESFAYRCLPLNIANAHGWELLNPCAFDACWNGRADIDAVTIRPHGQGPVEGLATSLFGQGIVTFHIPGIFRTPPGWNLWIGGSPNQPKDAIYPLTGVVETDWSPFTFTMNWRFTRPNHWIHFAAGEPICFLFPVQRALLDDVRPVLAPIEAEPGLLDRFQQWSRGRDQFVRRMVETPPDAATEKWQKHYYRGVDMSEKPQAEDHRTKLRLKPFDASAMSWPVDTSGPAGAQADLSRAAATTTPAAAATVAQAPDQGPSARTLLDLRKREWLLETLQWQRGLSPRDCDIERRGDLGSDEFLDRYYAANRPVILTGEMTDWPALKKWTPAFLKQAGYPTAHDSDRNIEAPSALHPDMGFPDKFLTREVAQPNGTVWIGPAGSLTSLRYDLTNNLFAQVVGRKRLLVLPAAEVGKLYNHLHVFSEIADLEDPALDLSRFPRLPDARFSVVTLLPGEMLFMPLAWWHQVRSIDFSVTVTYTNFKWPNDAYENFPAG